MILLDEIGQIVSLCGLCSASSGNSPQYLKETRASLSVVFNEVLKFLSRRPDLKDSLVKCLSQSFCVTPHLATGCVLSLEIPLLDWLVEVIRHGYDRHSTKELDHQHDSDSAICASDEEEIIQKRKVHKRLWTPYLERLLRSDQDIQVMGLQ